MDVGGPFKAVLPLLSFEGATKRNRPAVYEGDAVSARVVVANPDMDPVLSCVDASGRAAGFGHLKGGLLFECSSAWARALLARPPPGVLAALEAERGAFELCVGLNGRVWASAASAAAAAGVARCLRAAEEQLRPGDDAGAFVRACLAGGGGGGGGGGG